MGTAKTGNGRLKWSPRRLVGADAEREKKRVFDYETKVLGRSPRMARQGAEDWVRIVNTNAAQLQDLKV